MFILRAVEAEKEVFKTRLCEGHVIDPVTGDLFNQRVYLSFDGDAQPAVKVLDGEHPGNLLELARVDRFGEDYVH
ncbi:MAG: hypothetical protein AAB281_02215, partial [Actinomycetota bacterium]